jgi:recombination DNA repair RAD52 pathway protein
LRRILIGWGVLGTVGVVLVVVLALAVVNGCSRGTDSTESSSREETQAPSTASSGKLQDSRNTDSANKEYAVGDIVDLSDRVLKVNEAQTNYLPLNQSSRPAPGNQFVRVNVTLTNKSSDQISFTPFDFKVQDANGVQRSYTIAVDMPNPLNTGSLAPNDSVTANIAFEAPQGDEGFRLLYTPLDSPSETAMVNL